MSFEPIVITDSLANKEPSERARKKGPETLSNSFFSRGSCNTGRCSEIDQVFGIQQGSQKFFAKECQVSKRFEAIANALGVQAFRNMYNATVGKVIFCISKKNFMDTPSRRGLEKAIELTMKLEVMHTFGNVVVGLFCAREFALGNVLKGVISLGVNLAVNIYPIMLQICNRAKMLRVLYSRCNFGKADIG